MTGTRVPLADRFWRRVIRYPEGCWEWTGAQQGGGYGKIGCDGKHLLTHRVSWELLVGPIPAGLTIDHLCRNRICCNPAHLEPVTQAENNRRMSEFRPPLTPDDHCARGHLLSARSDGTRFCKVCFAAARKARNTREARPRLDLAGFRASVLA